MFLGCTKKFDSATKYLYPSITFSNAESGQQAFRWIWSLVQHYWTLRSAYHCREARAGMIISQIWFSHFTILKCTMQSDCLVFQILEVKSVSDFFIYMIVNNYGMCLHEPDRQFELLIICLPDQPGDLSNHHQVSKFLHKRLLDLFFIWAFCWYRKIILWLVALKFLSSLHLYYRALHKSYLVKFIKCSKFGTGKQRSRAWFVLIEEWPCSAERSVLYFDLSEIMICCDLCNSMHTNIITRLEENRKLNEEQVTNTLSHSLTVI